MWWIWENLKMLQTKCILFAVVGLTIVSSTIAIIGGQDAARGQFPYFVYIEAYKIPDLPVIFIYFYERSNICVFIA